MQQAQQRDSMPNVDQCSQEPIHIIGHIQSHGLLFALSEPDFIAHQVSANISGLLGLPPENVLGRSFEAILGVEQFQTFRSQVETVGPLTANPLRVRLGAGAIEMNCIAHRQDSVLVVELESVRGARSLEPLDIDAHIRIPITRMGLASDIAELSRLAAFEVQQLSGFEHVMVYRFDDQWNGEVIGEAMGSSLPSFLGHHFPASDIPSQARQLFLTTPLRAIADVGSIPVPLIPEIGPLTGRPLDLTHSFLRSASLVHIEYLRNMGVRSSLTVSIIVKQQLWGIIACHNAKPLHVDCSVRSVCELIGQILAQQVDYRTDNFLLQLRVRSRKELVSYMADVEASKSILNADTFQNPQLLDLFKADGLVSRIDGVLMYLGATATEEVLLPVIVELQKLASRGIASSSRLSALDPSAESYASQASGALYFGLKEGSDDYLLCLRREILKTVTWAGNPDKASSVDELGTLRPRNSFKAWQETVRGCSRPWNEIELENACFLREQLLRLQETQELSRVNKALAAEIAEREKTEEHLRQSEALLAHSAHHDHLTGLPNRMFLREWLNRALALASRHGGKAAVLFLDLDGFKHVNDSLGHAIGDGLLKSVALRLADCVRTSDLVCRQGGDEFIVILSEMPQAEHAAISAQRILSALKVTHSIGEHELTIGTSIGVSIYPDDGLDAETLIKNADIAMYQAKKNGDHSYQFFTPTMNERAVQRQSIEHDLRRALQGGGLTLHYQPKINLKTGEISGAEALLRWMHPTKGPIPAEEFIPIAEESGLIVPIGNWVLREACNQARAWRRVGLPICTLAVNVSAIEFRSERFLDGVFSALKDSQLEARSLELELTESVLMTRSEPAVSVLKRLRAEGVRVAIDDFGTGYCGLSYLRKFPIDAIKIDQSFIRQVISNHDDAAIVTAVVGLGRSLNMRVVAEGVETSEQMEFLQKLKCDEAQGYHFSRPLTARQLAELLEIGIQRNPRHWELLLKG
jgi:diguanylate cyclase (GGDEF)-like protein